MDCLAPQVPRPQPPDAQRYPQELRSIRYTVLYSVGAECNGFCPLNPPPSHVALCTDIAHTRISKQGTFSAHPLEAVRSHTPIPEGTRKYDVHEKKKPLNLQEREKCARDPPPCKHTADWRNECVSTAAYLAPYVGTITKGYSLQDPYQGSQPLARAISS